MAAKRIGPAAAALTKFEKDFAKAFGEDALEVVKVQAPPVVPTGSLSLDDAIGIGGYPIGKIIEWSGAEGCGKTTMAKIGAANFQQAMPDRLVGWIDVERSFHAEWAVEHGVNLDRRLFRLYKPMTAEDVSDAANKMVNSGLFSLIVIDSIGGMLGKAELEKEAEEATVAAVARVVARLCKQQALWLDTHQTTLFVINQQRAAIGGGPRATTTTTGGFALRHMKSLGLKARKTGDLPYMVGGKDDQEEVGFNLAVTVDKNRFAPPKRTAVFGLFNQDTDEYGPLGVDQALEAFKLGVRTGVIESPSKGWYLLDGVKVNGQPKTLNMLRADAELLAKLRVEILAARAAGVAVEVEEEPEPELDPEDIQLQEGVGQAHLDTIEPAP